MITIPMSPESRRIRRIALGDFVHRSALRFPDRTAVVDGDVRMNYAELDARSSRFAHWLIDSIGSSSQVGMLCANSADMVVAYNGIHKSGNVWVPVNAMLDARTIEYVLVHAEVAAVVVDEEFLANPTIGAVLRKLGLPLITARSTSSEPGADGVLTLAQTESSQPDSLPEVGIDPNQPALIMYTSGTTGNPKGAVHSHLSITTAIMGDVAGMNYGPSDVLGSWMPLFHCAQHSLAASICAVGGSLVIQRGFVPDAIARLVLDEGITVFFGLPLMYRALLADPDFKPSTVRLCIYAMAPIPGPLIKQIAERMTDNVLLATGQTEMYPGTMTFYPLQNPGRDANYWGQSLIHNETAVMDDQGNLLGPNQVGEIVHRGANAMLGYFKNPEATAEAQKYGWHHTGDLGMWDDGGQMLFVDRKKDMIKTGGENVASVKVESVLLAHPGVANVAVVGLPHPHWIEAVCAFIVRKPDDDCDEASIVTHCRAHLANFEIPKLIQFVDELPSTSTGKVRKNIVREQYLEMAAELWVDEA